MSLLCLSGTEFFYFPGEFFELIENLLVAGIFGAWSLGFQVENAAWFKSTRVNFRKFREALAMGDGDELGFTKQLLREVLVDHFSLFQST